MGKPIPDQETRIVHGLRLRATGEMLRVRADSGFMDDGETRYTLTTDPDCPLFDAEYEEAFRFVFAHPSGLSETRPLLGDYSAQDVEPVILTEVIRREVKPSGVAFENYVDISGSFATDLRGAIVRNVDGLSDLVDIVGLHADEIRAVAHGKENWERGPYHLVGLITPGKPDELPPMEPGTLIATSWNQRRYSPPSRSRSSTSGRLPARARSLPGTPR